MKREEFEALIEEIGRGADVDQEELAEALGYAGSLWYEIQQLTKKLCSGYRALQVDCARKDQKIEVTSRLLTAAKAENKRLREELEELRAGAVAHTVSRCTDDDAWSDGACLGFAVMGMRQASFSPKDTICVLEAMEEAMGTYTLEQAAEAHQALLEDREP